MYKRPFHPSIARFIAAGLTILLVLAALPVIPARAAAPAVTTLASTGVKRTGAQLNGIVNSNAEDTTVTFEYGLTTSYGTSMAATPGTVLGATTTDTVVSAQISGLLLPSTTYHFRAVGVNASGTTYGADLSFTTKAAGSTTYYVNNATACSDTNPGTSTSSPFCTIGKGAALADAGDIVSVLAGTYAETVKPASNGGSGMPIIFLASSGVTVTGRPDSPANTTSGGAFRLFNKGYITIAGFNIYGTADYGIIATASNHIVVMNNHVSYSGSTANLRSGIYLTATTDSTLLGNTTDHNTFDGIRLNNSSNNNWIEKNTSFGNATVNDPDAAGISLLKSSSNNTIIRNILYANEDSGINLLTGSGHNMVINNLTYGNGDHGIDSNTAPNNTLIGNTVHGNVTVGINFEVNSGGAIVMNNVSMDNGYRRLVGGGTFSTSNAGDIRVDETSIAGTTLDYNIYYGVTPDTTIITWGIPTYTTLTAFQAAVLGQESHGLQSNPLFWAPAPVAEKPPIAPFNVAIHVGDYHLSAGSPAIDSADSGAQGEQTVDIEGHSRVDIASVPNTGAGTRKYDDRGAYEFQNIMRVFLPLVIR